MSISNFFVRRAELPDIPFLVDGIIAAEKSGTDKLSYCTIFGLSEQETRSILSEILAEDVRGQELCVSNFQIFESCGVRVGAACAWVEGQAGKPSGVLKGNLLLHYVGRARIVEAAARLKIVEELNFARTPGTLQIESVYVRPDHRGQGIFGHLLDAHVRNLRGKLPVVSKAHIVLVKNNSSAFRAYEKAGFLIVSERTSNEPRILELLPAASKVLMERSLQ